MIEKPLVFIEWVDSQVLMGWQYEDVMKPLLPDTCYSVGFLIDDNADYKTLACSIGTGQVLARITIPTGCIHFIKPIDLPTMEIL